MAMLATALTPQALASWECEGRTCGTSIWFCCCAAPEGEQDANCESVDLPAADDADLSCPASCNCVLTISAGDGGQLAAVATTGRIVESPAALPQPLSLSGLLPARFLFETVETRGPPAAKLCLATPSLRGPPALHPSTVGF